MYFSSDLEGTWLIILIMYFKIVYKGINSFCMVCVCICVSYVWAFVDTPLFLN